MLTTHFRIGELPPLRVVAFKRIPNSLLFSVKYNRSSRLLHVITKNSLKYDFTEKLYYSRSNRPTSQNIIWLSVNNLNKIPYNTTLIVGPRSQSSLLFQTSSILFIKHLPCYQIIIVWMGQTKTFTFFLEATGHRNDMIKLILSW